MFEIFENKFFLFFLFFIPFIVLLFIYDISNTKKRSRIIAGSNIKEIIPYYTEGQKWLKLLFYTLAFFFIIVGLARPRWGIESIEANLKGRDTFILLDVSNSMAVSDIPPSRFESAKRYIKEYIDMETQDRIGIVIFSDKAELLVPLTTDYAAINFFLESLYPGMLGNGGTNISEGILEAIKNFDDSDMKNKMILLFTDGEDLEGNYYSMLEKIKEAGIKIFTIGIGTKHGEPIPIRNSKGEIESYIKDNNGNIVKSRLDEKKLIEIANTTNASYIRTSNNKGEIINFIKSINNVEKSDKGKVSIKQKKERYELFFIPALFFLALGFILDQGKIIKINNRFNWLLNKKILSFIFILLLLNKVYSINEATQDIEKIKSKNLYGDPNGGFWGNIEYKKGNYKKALENYTKSINFLHSEELGKLYYNIGNSNYKLNDLKNANSNYENSIGFIKNDIIKSKILYNQGLIAFKNKDYNTAMNLFKKAIQYNSKDDDARYNYTISRELAKQQQNQTNNNQQNQQKQNQNNNENNRNEDVQKLLNALDEKEKNEIRKKSEEQQKQMINKGNYW